MKQNNLRDYGLLILGAIVQAASMDLFLVPGQIASGGVSGLAQVLNFHTRLPIGMMALVSTFLGQGTGGGSDILARVLARLRGIPLSQSYLFTDALVVLLAGATFGWGRGLYAPLSLYVGGVTAEV